MTTPNIADQIPSDLETIVSVWRDDGARTITELAQRIGMSRSGTAARLARARRLGLIPLAPRRGPALRRRASRSSRLARITPSAFHRGAWRFVTEPAEIVHRGRVIGTFTPAGTAPPSVTPSDLHRMRVVPYELSGDLRADVLRALSDSAAALVELEELRGVRAGDHRRLSEYHRRQAALLLATRGPEPGTTQPMQTEGEQD